MYAEALASKERKVILFDQRGTGKSKLKRKDWYLVTMKDMVNDVEQLRLHLKIEKWDVMGHSFGGHYAQIYVSQYPSSVNKLILSASPNQERKNKWRKDFKKLAKADLTLKERETFDDFISNRSNHLTAEEKFYRTSTGFDGRHYVFKEENYVRAMSWFLYKCQPHPELILKLGRVVKKRRVQKKLKQFRNPVLIIHGKFDFVKLIAPRDNHRVFPNSELKIIDECGHMMLMDQREEYVETVVEFLDR
jgi:proline iminopeptidase